MAVKNVSSTEKTIKGMFSLLDSDNYTIDKTIQYCKYNELDYQFQFESILDLYRDYFEGVLEEVEVPEEYFYSPSWFSEIIYGTPDLDFLILYFAKMTSMFEFKKSKIKILPANRILEINKLIVTYKDAVRESYENPVEYIKENSLITYTK